MKVLILLGLGLFHLSLGLAPPSVKSIVEIVGFEGDLDLGLKELQTAFDSQCPRAAEAGT